MPFGPPYRPPCSACPDTRGWPDHPIYAAGCGNHRRSTDQDIPLVENITEVDNYAGSGVITPYPRPVCSSGCKDQPQCNSAGEVICDEGNVSETAKFCGPWQEGDFSASETPDYTLGVNRFKTSDEVVDLGACKKIGFKNVQAGLWWYGRRGFLDNDVEGCEPVPESPPQTLYRTVRRYGKYKWWDWETDPDIDPLEWEQQRSYTVNQHSGVVSQVAESCIEVQATGYTDAGKQAASVEYVCGAWVGPAGIGELGGDWSCLLNTEDYATCFEIADPDTVVATLTKSVTATKISFHFTLEVYSDDEHTMPFRKHEVWGEVELSDPFTADALADDREYLLGLWPLDDDKLYGWRRDELCGIAPYVSRRQRPGQINPDIWFPCDATAADLNGGADPSGFDGAVLGAPLKSGAAFVYGVNGCFDADHQTWVWLVCEEGPGSAFLDTVGAWNRAGTGRELALDPTDTVVPATAPVWTQNYGWLPFVAGNLPSGAWTLCSSGENGGFTYQQKWAETRVSRPSVNFFRPCGPDRLALDEVNTRCVTAFVEDNGSGKPQATLTSAVGIETGDVCYIGGTTQTEEDPVAITITPGFYEVTKVDDTNYTLDALDFAVTLDRTDGAILGKQRWPDAWPICGRCWVASAEQDEGDVLITLATPAPHLRTGDRVDFDGVAGLGADCEVTVTDASHFSVAGTLTDDYEEGGWIAAHGAPDWWWDDRGRKGDYLFVVWGHNFRDIAQDEELRALQASRFGVPQSVDDITVTRACIPYRSCSPPVLCISPNGETWPNGTTQNPARQPLDSRYGSMAQSAFVTQMVDPLWQVPHARCVQFVDCETLEPGAIEEDRWWREDDGTCRADVVCSGVAPEPKNSTFYPLRPYCEALAALPQDGSSHTAPALPDGLSLVPLTVASMNADPAPAAGQVIAPPSGAGYESDSLTVRSMVTPWGIWLREVGCSQNSGRFAADYRLNGIPLPWPS